MATIKHVNTFLQCSPATVGLAQARPNNLLKYAFHSM